MGRATSVGGWIVFFIVIAVNVARYRTRWEFGRYGMPKSLIGANGRYKDGGLVDPLTRVVVTSGWEEEVHLALATACLLGVIAVACLLRRAIVVVAEGAVKRDQREGEAKKE